jgi:hypothetical protein
LFYIAVLGNRGKGSVTSNEDSSKYCAPLVVKKHPKEWTDTGIKVLLYSPHPLPILTPHSYLFLPSLPSLADLHSWMVQEGIDQYYDVFKKQKHTGTSLLELKALLSMSTDPTQTIKKILVDGCNIYAHGDLLAITASLRRL